jgi:hypothetical protein
MQTFVPTGIDFQSTAGLLDRQRLGKQRVEGLQILRTLSGLSTGWQNHPAVRMWRGNEISLAHYTLLMCETWSDRGYRDTCADKVREMFPDIDVQRWDVLPPWWLDDDQVTLSHQSNLVRKFPEHYGPLWPTVPPTIPYHWPV